MSQHRVAASPEGLVLPAELDGSVDVLLNGWRVWSVTPGREKGASTGDGQLHVQWPRPLRKFLDGEADVVLRHHQADEVLFEGQVSFGSGRGRVSVTDQAGRPLVVTKNGNLNRPFEYAERESMDAYLDAVEQVLSDLRDCGLDAYVAWGTLLGAVRAGKLIGHDVDADVGYLSEHTAIVDVIRESYRIERVLRERGWTVRRMSAAFLAVFVKLPDGVTRNLDIFAGYIVDGWFYQIHDVCARLPRGSILPTSRVVLEGRELPAPADPAAWLEAAYGPHWATPDPGFSFDRSPGLRRRNNGWLGGLRGRRDLWRRAVESGALGPARVSPFAEWVVDQGLSPDPVVDLGCGRGADAVRLGENGRQVLGLDVVPGFVAGGTRRAASAGLSNVGFEECNFADARHALSLGARLALMGPVSLYSRRLLGDLQPGPEANFWRTVRMAMRPGGRLYLEFVVDEITMKDDRRVGPPTRRVMPKRVIKQIERRGGRLLRREQFVEPDQPAGATVCRLVAEWDA